MDASFLKLYVVKEDRLYSTVLPFSKNESLTLNHLSNNCSFIEYAYNNKFIIVSRWGTVKMLEPEKMVIRDLCSFQAREPLRQVAIGFDPSLSRVMHYVTDNKFYNAQSEIALTEFTSGTEVSFHEKFNICNILRIFQRDTLWYMFYVENEVFCLQIRDYSCSICLHSCRIFPEAVRNCILLGTLVVFVHKTSVYKYNLFDTKPTCTLTIDEDIEDIISNGNFILLTTCSNAILVINVNEILDEKDNTEVLVFPSIIEPSWDLYVENDMRWSLISSNFPIISCPKVETICFHNKLFIEALHEKCLDIASLCESTFPITICQKRKQYQLKLIDPFYVGDCIMRVIESNKCSQMYCSHDLLFGMDTREVFEVVFTDSKRSAFIYIHPISGLQHFVVDSMLIAKHFRVSKKQILLYSCVSNCAENRKTTFITVRDDTMDETLP